MGGPWPVADVLGYLAGRWGVERTVRDLGDGTAGTFSGTTDFTREEAGGGLLHHEAGTFVWQGAARAATRTLRFLLGEVPGTAVVRFSDGRFFHGLDLRTGRHTADHPCAADLYRGEFEVAGPDAWRMEWRVRGPAKDLVLTTTYTRTA
ncbi:hypothetical protein EOT10_13770 [Streptomyces antnestii]|uniref:DUF6314 domain-containing protein n=1 Tax=Streptomyces antnestii TaxID=2494256 RepID=A0A3S2VYF9_9ACTN|nr:DUF6314 family protein [Streptomyces sp. San01]RVU25488.1 hypothetical protein EOT10_13770 [Streptomyces sp. San01]